MSKVAKPSPQRNPKNQAFDPKFWEKPGVSADEVQEIKDAFDIFDTDKSGAVSIEELVEAMQSLGIDKKNESVFSMIKDIDTDGSGELEFQEFLEMMTARLSANTPVAELEKVFKIFDSDRSGEITLDNLKNLANQLGEEVSNEELQEMITRNDVDKDGSWSFEDFCAVMTGAADKKTGRQPSSIIGGHPKHVPKMNWSGRFKQGKDWHEMEFEHMMIDKAGYINGNGKDDFGTFNLGGSCDVNGNVSIDKKYIGAHTVLYKGKMDGQGAVKGSWEIAGSGNGNFELKSNDSLWTGWFMQGKSKSKNKFATFLILHGDFVYGYGMDNSGCFCIIGKHSNREKTVEFEKTYYGKEGGHPFKGELKAGKKTELDGEFSSDGGKTWDVFHLEY